MRHGLTRCQWKSLIRVHVCIICLGVFADLGRLGLQGHQAGGSVCQHMKVRGGWGTHGCGPALGVHLVVYQTPLLQEGVDSAAEGSQRIQQLELS